MGSLALALGLVGLVFVRLLTGLHEEQSRAEIAGILADLRREIFADREHLVQTAQRFARRADVVASVHLVENYQDPEHYRPLIFDVEKERLAHELQVVARAARAVVATVQGADSGLMAFYAPTTNGGLPVAGFATYVAGASRYRLLDAGNTVEGPLPSAVAAVAGPASAAAVEDVLLRRLGEQMMQVAVAPIRRGDGPPVGYVRFATPVGASLTSEFGPRAALKMTVRFVHGARDDEAVAGLPRLDAPEAFTGDAWWVPDDTHFAGGAWLPLDGGGRAEILLSIPKKHVVAGIASFRTAALSGLVIVALVVGPLGLYFVHRTLSQPVERLKASIRGLGAGRFQALEAGAIEPREIRDVFEALNIMAEAVARRESELRESRQRYHDLYERAPVAYASVEGANRHIAECNGAFETITGRSRSKLRHSDFLSLFGEGANGRILAQGILRRAERGEPSENVELRLQRPDGRMLWVSLTAHPITNDDGHMAETRVAMLNVTERREAQYALMRSLDELARANAELERFAHVAAHDLKEPVRQIVAYAQLLKRRLVQALSEPDPDLNVLLGYIIEGGQRLSALIDDLLAYAGAAHREAVFERVDMTEVVATALDNLREAVRERDARVHVGELPAVRGDRLQLVQLMQNLLGNALKFVPPERHPEIHVEAGPEGSDWRFTVRDNGIGIEAAHLSRIFDVFHRVHPRNVYPGTGIGLSICKRVVEQHGGRIWAESTPGAGTAFHFTLPGADDPLAGRIASGHSLGM